MVERDEQTTRIEHDHPAAPEQVGSGYAEGLDRKPDEPEENLEPNFARGIAEEDQPAGGRHGRFSDGNEDLPDTPEKEIERRFSEGIERSPTSE